MSLELVYEIYRERRRGASWIFGKALEAMDKAVEENTLATVIEMLSRYSPVLKRLADVVVKSERPVDVINKLVERYRESRLKLVEACEGLVEGTITTISYSSAVMGCISSNRVEKVYVLESRPGDEALYAYREYVGRGIKAELVPDTYVVRAVKGSDFVLFGADLVDPRGVLYNKVGTYPLALVAKHLFKPVVAVFESFKVVEGSIEDELFEGVPMELIDRIITDVGVSRAERGFLRQLAEYFYRS